MRTIELLFRTIDERWQATESPKIHLHVIGSAALLLQTDYDRGTKDGDVFETLELTPKIQERLLKLAGPQSEIRRQVRLYVDIVRNGIPFLAHQPQWTPATELNRILTRFTVSVLSVADVSVSKLKRFSASDISDIDAMISRGHLDHRKFVERFRAAADVFLYDARASELPGYIANLHRVERDMFGVEPTEIELPSWA